MAKLIAIPKDFRQADGSVFRQAKRDTQGYPVLRLSGEGKPLLDPQGQPIIEMEEIGFGEVLKIFLNTLFPLASSLKKELTIEDSANAIDVLRTLRVVQDGYLELENVPYEWLSKKVSEYGVGILGINAGVVLESLRQVEDKKADRAERRRDEKARVKA